jgi:hypothetical protein
MKHENILRRVETEAGIDATRRDPGKYYTSDVRRPRRRLAVGWRFEGHHLSINVTHVPGPPSPASSHRCSSAPIRRAC